MPKKSKKTVKNKIKEKKIGKLKKVRKTNRKMDKVKKVKKVKQIKKANKAKKEAAIDQVKNSDGVKKMKIRVIGIGGGGGSIISEIASKMQKASFIAANTDSQALKALGQKISHFQFGENLTHGLGAGMNAELGQEAAVNAEERISKILEGQDLCIFVVSLGGGAGSGAVPVFAKIAKNLGNLTYGIFTLPFKFEGEKKAEIARTTLKKVKNYLNAFSVIPNDRVFEVVERDTPLKQALSVVNKNLADSLGGLIETLYQAGLINIDFADFKTVLDGQGKLAYLNTIEVQRKEGAMQELIDKALNSPFYPYGIRGAKGTLFNIFGEKNLSLAEVRQISRTISELVSSEAKIIFGISQSQQKPDVVKTMILANGCSSKIFSLAENNGEIKKKKKAVKKNPSKSSDSSPNKKKKSGSKKGAKPNDKKPKQIRIKIGKINTGKTRREDSQPLAGDNSPKDLPPNAPEAQRLVQIRQVLQVNGEQIRKNALQVKKESEAAEREMMEKENFWDTPAFLRRKMLNDK